MSTGPLWEVLFDELADLPPSDRDRRLAALADEDPVLAARLAELLAADGEPTDRFDRPAAELLGEGPSLPAGTRIGSWQLLGLLGRGGMGEVYCAERDEGTFRQQAALKLIKRGMDSRAIVRRFLRERQILSRLDHPGIARLLDGGSTADGRPFFVLERVEGIPITELCRGDREDGSLAPPALDTVLRLVQDVCAAVDSAHRRLVVHRDLKPANILVTRDGTVKLLDFGIAKLLAGGEDEETAPFTQLDARVMTPSYAAPEQILGEPVTTATDVYALGVLTFELITGTLPHTRDQRSIQSMAAELPRQTVERPSAVLRRAPGEESRRLARRVAGDLDLVVLTALHRDPARRYPSAAAFADDLARALSGRPIRARPDTARYRLRKFVGRNRLAVTATALGLAALVGGLGMALWQMDAARQAARRADAEARRAERVKAFLLSVFEQSDPERPQSENVTARELLARGARRVDEELAGEPVMRAEMLDAVARSEANLGLIDAALAHARRALALREAALPRGDARIAASRILLGDVTRFHGDLGQSRPLLERGLAETVAAHGADSFETAVARRSLANALHRPEDQPRAIVLLRQSLGTLRRLRGDEDILTVEVLMELGVFLERADRYEEAETILRQALGRLVHALGAGHPKVATAQADLAGLLDRLGHSAEPRELFEKAIATQRAVYGPRHPALAQTLFSYGLFLVGQRQPGDEPLREALSYYGPDRYEGAHCLRYLGVSAMRQDRYQEAAGLFSRAAVTYERTLGLDDTQHWRALANLGWAHLKLDRIGQAREELTTAAQQIERLTSPESYELRQPLKHLGETLTRAGIHDEAVSTLERVRRMEEKLFGTPRHREVAASDLLLSRARIARGRPGDREAARRDLDEALSIFSDLPRDQDAIYAEILAESRRLGLTGN